MRKVRPKESSEKTVELTSPRVSPSGPKSFGRPPCSRPSRRGPFPWGEVFPLFFFFFLPPRVLRGFQVRGGQ